MSDNTLGTSTGRASDEYSMKFVTVQSLEVSSPFQNVRPPRAGMPVFTEHLGDDVGSIFDRLGGGLS